MVRARKWFVENRRWLLTLVAEAVVTLLIGLAIGYKYRPASLSFSPAGKSNTSLSVRNVDSRNGPLASRSTARNGDEILLCVEFYNHSKGAKAKDIDVILSLGSNSTNEMVFDSSVSALTAYPLLGKASVITEVPGSLIDYEETAKWFQDGKYQQINVEPIGNSISLTVNGMIPGIDHGGRAEFRGKIQYSEIYSVADTTINGGLSIRTTVSTNGKDFQKSVHASPADEFYFQIHVENVSNSTIRDLMVKDNLPPRANYVAGSTYLYNGTYRSGVQIKDEVVRGGLNIGNYTPGSSANIIFKVTLDSAFQPGVSTLTNVGVARADGIRVIENKCQIWVKI